MELDLIKLQTTWNDAAGSINTNFSKIQMAIASLEGGSGGLNEDELLAFLVENGYITTDDLSDYYTKYEVNELIDQIKAGDIDLANYYTKEEIDGKGFLTSASLVGYAKTTDVDAVVDRVELLEDAGYATTGYVSEAISDLNIGQFATKTALAVTVEALSAEIGKKANADDVADTYATKTALSTVDNRLVSIESYFATSEDAGNQIDKWNEIVAFLNATEGTTLAGILAAYTLQSDFDALSSDVANISNTVKSHTSSIGSNASAIGVLQGYFTNGVAKKATADASGNVITSYYTPISTHNALATRVGTAEGNITSLANGKADKATTLAGYGITNAYTKTEVGNAISTALASYYTITQIDGKIATINDALDNRYTKTEANNLLKKYLLLEAASQTIKGDITIEGNLIITGDVASGGEGGNTSAEGTVTGVTVSGVDYTSVEAGLLDLTDLMANYALKSASTKVSVSPSLSSGKSIGVISVDGVGTTLYAPATYAWSEISGKVTDSGVFSFIDSSFTLKALWFNYRTLQNTNLTNPVESYHMGNGAIGYAGVVASKFIVNGGTSSQFLKADGSVDSTSYLPLTGGTIESAGIPLTIKRTNNSYSIISFYGIVDGTNQHFGYLGFSGVDEPIYLTPNGSGRTLLHSGNYSNYALPLSGGTISNSSYGALEIMRTSTTVGFSGIKFSNSGGVLGYIGMGGTGSDFPLQPIFSDGASSFGFIHSGNVGGYAMNVNKNLDIQTSVNEAGYAYISDGWRTTGAAITIGASSDYRMAFQGDYGNTYGIRLQYSYCYEGEWKGWKTIAFTNSNITGNASSASKVMLNYSYKQNIEYPLVFASRDNIGVAQNGLVYVDYYGKPTYNTSTETLTVPNLKLQTPRTIWGQSFDGTGDVLANSGVGLMSSKGKYYGLSILPMGNPYYGVRTFLTYDEGTTMGSYEIASRTVYGLTISHAGGVAYDFGNIPSNLSYAMLVNIRPNGNVGIGTTSPAYKLDVHGSTHFEAYDGVSYVHIGPEAFGTKIQARGDGNTYFQSQRFDSTTAYYNIILQELGGNVGIGTTDPKAKLDVDTSFRVFNSANNVCLLVSSTASNVMRFAALDTTMSAWYAMSFGYNNQLYLNPASTKNNYVGINRNDPFYQLDVAGTGRFTGAVTMDSTLEVTGHTYINGGAYLKGGVEVYYSTPYIDFHFGNATDDYTSRIIEIASGNLAVYANWLPNTNNARKLGNSDRRWSEIYGVNGDFSNAVTVSGALTANSGATITGDVTINGNLIVSGDVASGGTGQDTPSGGTTTTTSAEWYNIKTRREPAPSDGNLSVNFYNVIENYNEVLNDSSKYRMVIMRFKRGSYGSKHWAIPMFSNRWDRDTGEVINEGTWSWVDFENTWWSISSRIVNWFANTGATLQTSGFSINTKTDLENRIKFSNSNSKKMRMGVAIYKKMDDGLWQRVSNIAEVMLFVNNYGDIYTRVIE